MEDAGVIDDILLGFGDPFVARVTENFAIAVEHRDLGGKGTKEVRGVLPTRAVNKWAKHPELRRD